MLRLFHLLAALSLLLSIGIAVFWIRSYLRPDELVFRHALLVSDHGSVGLQIWPEHRGYQLAAVATPHGPVHVLTWPSNPTMPARIYFASYLFLLLESAGLPVLWMLAWIHRRRRAMRTGFCKTCGYDLRATPGRCPECGTEVAAPK